MLAFRKSQLLDEVAATEAEYQEVCPMLFVVVVLCMSRCAITRWPLNLSTLLAGSTILMCYDALPFCVDGTVLQHVFFCVCRCR